MNNNNKQNNQQNNQPLVSNSLTALDALTEQLNLEARMCDNNSVPNTKSSNTKLPNTKSSSTKLPNTKSSNTKLPNTKMPNTKMPNTKLPNTKLSNTKLLNTKLPNTKLPDTKLSDKKLSDTKLSDKKLPNTKLSGSKIIKFNNNKKEKNNLDVIPIDLSKIDINDLNDQIKKLEFELKKNKTNKINTLDITNEEKNMNSENEIKYENNKKIAKNDTVNDENNSTLSENEINKSKKALIKMFLEAKKNKITNNLILNAIPTNIDIDIDIDNNDNVHKTTDTNNTDNSNKNNKYDNSILKVSSTNIDIDNDNINKTTYANNIDNLKKNINSYDERFIEVFDQNYKNESQVMNIDFNDPESAKLIKVIADEDNNYMVPTNVKIRSTNLNNSFVISRNNVGHFVKECVDFEVNSSSITSFDCYNDYMVNLLKSINITNIKIKSIELPKNLVENINRSNNELKIIIDDKEQIFELEENYYNRYEIKDFLNEAFNAYNFDIMCDIQEDNFIFTSNSKFAMINHETSILPTLGFNRTAYVNRNIYSAENCHQIGDNIFYIIIENISEQPLFYINNDSGEIKKLQEIEPMVIDHLIIKFNKTHKDLVKNNKNYNFFFDKSHFIAFELMT